MKFTSMSLVLVAAIMMALTMPVKSYDFFRILPVGELEEPASDVAERRLGKSHKTKSTTIRRWGGKKDKKVKAVNEQEVRANLLTRFAKKNKDNKAKGKKVIEPEKIKKHIDTVVKVLKKHKKKKCKKNVGKNGKKKAKKDNKKKRDEKCKKKRKQKKTKEEAKKTRVPGACVADHICAEIRGDPHITTFDGQKYDCQGAGEYVLARSMDTPFEVQGRFSKGVTKEGVTRKSGSVTITTGISIDTGVEGAPDLDIFTELVDGECVVNYYVDGAPADFGQNGKRISGIEFIDNYETDKGVVDYVFFEGSAIMFTTSSRMGGLGCVLDSKLCLPPSMVKSERIIGLLGSPDGNPANDWMSQSGENLFGSDWQNDAKAKAYCTANWCVAQADDSIFGYLEGTAWSDFYDCDGKADELLKSLQTAPPAECTACCDGIIAKEDYQACLTECIEDGTNGCELEIINQELLSTVERQCPDPEPDKPDDKKPSCSPIAQRCWDGTMVFQLGTDCQYAACPDKKIEVPDDKKGPPSCDPSPKKCKDGSFIVKGGDDCKYLTECPKGCGPELKECWDGTMVSKVMPNCDEFAKCPEKPVDEPESTLPPPTCGGSARACPDGKTLVYMIPPACNQFDTCPEDTDPTDKTTDMAFTRGDPHFKTFGGELYDFHGECDLVLLHNPEFKDNLGMDVHIRTKITDWWSSVESAAVRIGDHTLEIRASDEHKEWFWLDGVANGELEDGKWNRADLSGFMVRYKETDGKMGRTRQINIYLEGVKEVMILKSFKSFVRVDIDWKESENYYGSTGLLGSHADNGARLGRDGKPIEDVNAFGQDWQVLATEPQLFHSYEGAVVPPNKCKMPEDSEAKQALRRRRLAEGIPRAEAEQLCDHLRDAEEKEACVFDVLATQDKFLASAW